MGFRLWGSGLVVQGAQSFALKVSRNWVNSGIIDFFRDFVSGLKSVNLFQLCSSRSPSDRSIPNPHKRMHEVDSGRFDSLNSKFWQGFGLS